MIQVDKLMTSPNEAKAIGEINAIYEYVRAQRVNTPKYPAALPVIQAFEAWYQGLEESAKESSLSHLVSHIIDESDVNEAKRRRSLLNDAIDSHLPDDQIPADSPQTPPTGPDYEQGKGPEDGVKTALALGGVALGALILWKLLT